MSAYTLIGVGRFINMLGYPLFAVTVHQITVQEKPIYPETILEIEAEGPDPSLPFQVSAETSRPDGEPPTLNTTLERMVKKTAETLNADVCAILLVDPQEPASIHLVARYTYPQYTEQATLRNTSSIAEQPAIAYALKRRKQLVVNTGTDYSRLETLYELLDSQESGPTIVQPILGGNRALGVLVLGNNYTRRAFEPKAVQLCRTIAEQVAAVL
jgi:signal transduction protein with GAF and PtsI domain